LDLEWNTPSFFRNDHGNIKDIIEKPKAFDKMIEICRKSAKDIPFVRVDLYCIKEKIYFSELTFSLVAVFLFFLL
jgi:hypothetical protein